MNKIFVILVIFSFIVSCNDNEKDKLKQELQQKESELKRKDEELRQKQLQETQQREAEQKRKQDSIVNAKKPENICKGTWKQVVNEFMGQKVDKPANVLTINDDGTYKEKLIMADGVSAKFETGRWKVKDNELILLLEVSDYANYVESMHYAIKDNKLILKYWTMQNGDKSTPKEMNMREEFKKISQ